MARILSRMIASVVETALCSLHELNAERPSAPPDDFALLTFWVIGHERKAEPGAQHSQTRKWNSRLRILAAAWQRVELELAPHHVIGCLTAKRTPR
jgi:hypothetical protein